MGNGYLTVQVQTANGALPVSGAHVILYDKDGNKQGDTYTDANGNTQTWRLFAPDRAYTLDPNYQGEAYSVWDVDVEKENFVSKHIHGVEVVDTQTSILPVKLEPKLTDAGARTDEEVEIPPMALTLPDAGQPGPRTETRSLRQVRIPDEITVHLGTPSNSAARNVRVPFPDYIKNVTSGEIYSTWPQNALIANIHAIVTFALNRVYTEWYRSRGFQFDITSSTAYDQYYRDGAQIFENISRLVDLYFNTYAHRRNFQNPFFTSFCNGTTTTCNGLSQWGTVTLANRGMMPLQILRNYYPNDLELSTSDNIVGITNTYPGYPLRVGSQGEAVRRIQNDLNRIRNNYPLIPAISNPNGQFGSDTADAVRTFQRTFSLATDGIVGQATWNKIAFIFAGVTRLAELDSEGIRGSIGDTPPTTVLSQGSRGEDVRLLQFILNALAPYYDEIPPVVQDGIFGPGLKNAVIAFQKAFELPQDGVVGSTTWNKLYTAYHAVQSSTPVPPAPPTAGETPVFPGTTLQEGSRGEAVRTMQTYLNTIRSVYTNIPELVVDGIFGPNTRASVTAFQNTFLLPPSGNIDERTWDYIVQQFQLVTGGASVSLQYPGTPLRLGSAGSNVRLMQTFLNDLRSPYPSLPALTADGIFGPRTQEAVILFQRLFSLTPDGIIGPITWNKIVQVRNESV